MKNKRNKKLLSSMLVAALLTTISASNKFTNAAFEAYKSDERHSLGNVVNDIKKIKVENFREESKVKNKYVDFIGLSFDLLNNLDTILRNREKSNSDLKNSLNGNGLNIDYIIEIRNKLMNNYGKDICLNLMYDFVDKLSKVKGGFDTVWEKKGIKEAVKTLKSKLVEFSRERMFTKLGGKQEDIDDYKSYLKEKYNNELKLSENKEDIAQIDKELDRELHIYNKDKDIETRKKMLERVLRIHSFKNKDKKVDAVRGKGKQAFFTQGYGDLCCTIIDKFLGSNNQECTEDMEAKIYYVYDKLFDRLKLLDAGHNLDNLSGEKFKELCAKTRDNFTKNYPNLKLPQQFADNSCNEGFLSVAFINAIALCERDVRINILDEIVFQDLDSDNAIQKLADEVYKLVIRYDQEYKNTERGRDAATELSSYGMALFSYIQGKVAGLTR